MVFKEAERSVHPLLCQSPLHSSARTEKKEAEEKGEGSNKHLHIYACTAHKASYRKQLPLSKQFFKLQFPHQKEWLRPLKKEEKKQEKNLIKKT